MWTRTFSSFDDYAAAVHHAHQRLALIERKETNWKLSYLPLNDWSVQWGQGAGNVFEGATDAAGLTIFMPCHNASAIIGNGQRFSQGSLMIFNPNEDFCLASTASNRWFSMFIPGRVLPKAGEREKDWLQSGQRVMLPPKAGTKLFFASESLYNALQQAPEAFLDPVTRGLTGQKLAEAAQHVLFEPTQKESPIGRPPVPRAQIIGMAMSLMEDRFKDRLTVPGISSSIGVSERTLRNAFEAYFGMSPAHYLKLRTLHQARRQLKAADPSTSTVTQIASRLGIWEFGRFARDYRILFGERPSETLHK